MIGRLFHNLTTRAIAQGLLIAAALILLWGFVSNIFEVQYVPFFQVLLDDLYANVGSELLSIVLTVLVIEELNARRSRTEQEERDQKEQEEEERRSQQIRDELRKYIQAQELARLRAATTKEERQPILDSMVATGLLEGADLQEANLAGAKLGRAKLEGADLQEANLAGARLYKADLERAFLLDANLQGVLRLTLDQLRSAEILQGATLPDGTQLPDDDTWQQAFDDWLESNPL